MEYKRIHYLIMIVNFLALVFLAFLSGQFLWGQYRKTKEVDPQIMAQYQVNLEVEKYLEILKKIKK